MISLDIERGLVWGVALEQAFCLGGIQRLRGSYLALSILGAEVEVLLT